jgi:hypothetical protein
VAADAHFITAWHRIGIIDRIPIFIAIDADTWSA